MSPYICAKTSTLTNTTLAIEEEQQACTWPTEAVEELQSTTELVWKELGNCAMFTMSVHQTLPLIGESLSCLQYSKESWALDTPNTQLSQVLGIVEGYQTIVNLKVIPLITNYRFQKS